MYTYRNAIATAYRYLGINQDDVKVIENTNGRGIVYEFDGAETVIFIYPISCKQNNRQNFFDTRDSGSRERIVTWNYACEHGLRYFCLGFNDEQDRYKDYVLSLESDEKAISSISYRRVIGSDATGTQVNIPNDFIPNGQFQRIKTPKGFYISAINKDYIVDYIKMFDNRPYCDDLVEENIEELELNDTQLEQHEVAKGGINKIFYGAPGCGKSHYVSELLKSCNANDENIFRVTFHPEYLNSDFVGQILPTVETVVDDNGEQKDIVKYNFNPGPFTLALKKAYSTSEMVYLIIEEINRGNAAAIFGDLFQLLDRVNDTSDEKYSTSEYPIRNPNVQDYLIRKEDEEPILVEGIDMGIYIPSNLTIFATMNSSDQNVFTLDTAFKRRWLFEQISNDIVRDTNHQYKNWYIPGTNVTWERFLVKLNEKILDNKIQNQTNEDKRLGKYFVTKECLTENEEDIQNVKEVAHNFAYKVLEYVWNDVCKIGKEDWFDIEKYKTLEDLIEAFENPAEGKTPLDIFINITF